MFEENTSPSVRVVAVIVTLGLLVAMTAFGIVRVSKWAYSLAYPAPTDSTVSLSAGFDKMEPTVATTSQQASASTEAGSRTESSQTSSQSSTKTPEGTSPQQLAEQNAP